MHCRRATRPLRDESISDRTSGERPTAACSSRVHGLDASECIDVDGVVAVADDLDASVIVVGSRGLSGAREVLERSLSHDLARRAWRRLPIVPPAVGCG
jgi:Universal stress protein family